MDIIFYISAVVAVFATIMAITRLNAIHALLYLVVSLIAVAVVFYTLGAAFVAALELIIYAGAIMVLFIFVVMLLNLGERAAAAERELVRPGIWIGPAILAAILIVEVARIVWNEPTTTLGNAIPPRTVGMALYGPYVLGVELASMLLLAGLVGAYHLGWRRPAEREVADAIRTRARRVDSGGDFVRAGDGRAAGSP